MFVTRHFGTANSVLISTVAKLIDMEAGRPVILSGLFDQSIVFEV